MEALTSKTVFFTLTDNTPLVILEDGSDSSNTHVGIINDKGECAAFPIRDFQKFVIGTANLIAEYFASKPNLIVPEQKFII